MKPRPEPVTHFLSSGRAPARLYTHVALWLLDHPHLSQKPGVRHFAGRLLKQPARQGVVAAQSRLGLMLCRDCGNTRDRRIGHDLLRQAARAGDCAAQFEYGRLCVESPINAPQRARYWLELASAKGSLDARRLLVQMDEHQAHA